MCVSILIDGELCETMADLRKAVRPVEPVILSGYSLPVPGRCCLCPVDIEATAAAIGRIAEDCDEDSMRLRFVPRVTA